MRCVAFLFDDKRATSMVLVMWLTLVFSVFLSLGVLNSPFFSFGPSPSLRFMNVTIDTWGEWGLLSAYCCLDTLVKSFGHDAVVPWLTTTVVDPKNRTLPYSKSVCLVIVETYYCYIHLSYIFKFFLSFTQFDFVLFTALSDMAMKVYSYSAYMRDKACSQVAAAEFSRLQEQQDGGA